MANNKAKSPARATIRVVVTGGGTGGHVYPALAVVETLRDEQEKNQRSEGALSGVDFLYIGSRGGMEEGIVARASLKFTGVSATGVRGKAPWQVLAAVGQLGRGIRQSRGAIANFGATIVLATGGYVSVPVVLAAMSRGIPVVVYLPDVEPGWAVKFTSRFAAAVAVTTEASTRYLPAEKVKVTGYPVRTSFAECSQPEARRYFGLAENEPVVLVFGGSRGSRSINDAVVAGLPDVLPLAQVIHICGEADLARVTNQIESLPSEWRRRYVVKAFLDQGMGQALASADICVSRAGASILGEYPFFGLPSILVPYPFAGAHQERNADLLVARGAAVKLADEDLSSLTVVLADLLEDGPRRQEMAGKCRALAKPGAASAIGHLLLAVAGQRSYLN